MNFRFISKNPRFSKLIFIGTAPHMQVHLMRLKLKHVLVLSALVAMIASPVAFGASIDIKGHSPITLLVTDPYGHSFGCNSSTCSGGLVDQLSSSPGSESGSYTCNPSDPGCPGFLSQTCSGDCPLITIMNPDPGTWTVHWYSALSSGSYSIEVTAVETNCPVGEPCSVTTTTIVSSTPITSGQSGTGDPVNCPPSFCPTGYGVPEFAFGAFLLVALLAPALMLIRKLRPVGAEAKGT